MGIIIYARKSTDREDRQVQSLEDQVQELKRIALREGWHVTQIITESRSAKAPGTRPEFQRLMRLAEDGKVSGILTWSINRLSRNLVDGGLVAHLLQTGQIPFIRTADRVYRPEDNVLLMSIENGMATAYVQDLRKNVVRGMRGKCERGWFPGKPPLGYRNNAETRQIDPHPKVFPLVKRGWELLATGGYAITDIHVELQKMGIEEAAGTRIHRSHMYRIYKNIFYTGNFSYDGVLYEGKHQPMLTVGEYNRIQNRLAGKVSTCPKNKPHMFSGLFRCAACGCAVVGETKVKRYADTGRTVSYTYYHCSGTRGCPRAGLSEAGLIKAIQQVHEELEFSDAWRGWCEQALKSSIHDDSIIVEHAQAGRGAKLDKLRVRLHKLTELRLDGELDSEEYQATKKAIQAEIAALEALQNSPTASPTDIDEYILEKIHATKALEHPDSLARAALRGMFASLGTNHTLTLGKLEIDLDPVILKMCSLEPLENGSDSHKQSGSDPSIPAWCTICNDARKIARQQLSQ